MAFSIKYELLAFFFFLIFFCELFDFLSYFLNWRSDLILLHPHNLPPLSPLPFGNLQSIVHVHKSLYKLFVWIYLRRLRNKVGNNSIPVYSCITYHFSLLHRILCSSYTAHLTILGNVIWSLILHTLLPQPSLLALPSSAMSFPLQA